MRRIKEILLGALVGLTLAGCVTITPKGSIDIAYIPQRTDDQIVKNEVMTELDAGLEAKVVEGRLKNTKIRIGGRQRTYMTPESLFSFNPNRQEYDIYGNVRYENFKFYIEYMCSHPLIDETEKWIYDKETGNYYIINHDSITKVGVKLEF